MRLDGGGTTDLVRLATEPALSPDGTRVAFAGYLNLDVVKAEEGREYAATELYAMNIDGTGVRRLTRTEGVIETSPSWDPSGQRIAYVQVAADTSFVAGLALLFPVGNAIMQVNADGTCRERLYSSPKSALYGVSWQQGTGHEAGPIAC